MAETKPEYTLHTYFRSSCSGRVRIALNLKGIPYEPIFVNLLKGEQKSAQNLAANPLGFVPSLTKLHRDDAVASSSRSGVSGILTQSLAILEYLEEAYPDRISLLPPASDLAGRAHVRALASVIACDVQPVTNLRILRRVAELGGGAGNGADREWAKWLIADGFAAYEALAAPAAGRFSYGDAISVADVCLVPAVYGAARFAVDLEPFPTIRRVFANMSLEDAVVRASWKEQPDCPEELRSS